MPTLERLRKLFIAKFDFNVEELKSTTTLEALGFDSLDKIEFMFDIENEFKVIMIQDRVDAIDRFVFEQVSLPRNSVTVKV